MTETSDETDDPEKAKQNISKNWKRIEKQNHDNVMLLRQGNVAYRKEEGGDTKTHLVKKKIETDDFFEFDPDIPPLQRFINFKAEVIGRSLNSKDDNFSESNSSLTRSHKSLKSQKKPTSK